MNGDIVCVCALPCILLTLFLGSEEEESDEEEAGVEEKKASPAKEAPRVEDDVKATCQYCTSSTPYHKNKA